MNGRKRGLFSDEKGQSLVEYGTITGMIGSVISAIATFFTEIGKLLAHLWPHH
jgi:Flp pilus assembly pilin Flp